MFETSISGKNRIVKLRLVEVAVNRFLGRLSQRSSIPELCPACGAGRYSRTSGAPRERDDSRRAISVALLGLVATAAIAVLMVLNKNAVSTRLMTNAKEIVRRNIEKQQEYQPSIDSRYNRFEWGPSGRSGGSSPVTEVGSRSSRIRSGAETSSATGILGTAFATKLPWFSINVIQEQEWVSLLWAASPLWKSPSRSA